MVKPGRKCPPGCQPVGSGCTLKVCGCGYKSFRQARTARRSPRRATRQRLFPAFTGSCRSPSCGRELQPVDKMLTTMTLPNGGLAHQGQVAVVQVPMVGTKGGRPRPARASRRSEMVWTICMVDSSGAELIVGEGAALRVRPRQRTRARRRRRGPGTSPARQLGHRVSSPILGPSIGWWPARELWNFLYRISRKLSDFPSRGGQTIARRDTQPTMCARFSPTSRSNKISYAGSRFCSTSRSPAPPTANVSGHPPPSSPMGPSGCCIACTSPLGPFSGEFWDVPLTYQAINTRLFLLRDPVTDIFCPPCRYADGNRTGAEQDRLHPPPER